MVLSSIIFCPDLVLGASGEGGFGSVSFLLLLRRVDLGVLVNDPLHGSSKLGEGLDRVIPSPLFCSP